MNLRVNTDAWLKASPDLLAFMFLCGEGKKELIVTGDGLSVEQAKRLHEIVEQFETKLGRQK